MSITDTLAVKVDYGFAAESFDGSTSSRFNDDILFETSSAIKSPIGALAIMKAAHEGVDLDSFTLTVGAQHHSNGSGDLKDPSVSMDEHLVEDSRAEAGACIATLGALVKLNIVESDCVATNVLIDYLGGADVINNRLQHRLGLDSMSLVSDRIYFPGVDHEMQPFQVGSATLADFVAYYSKLPYLDLFSKITPKTQSWYQKLHLSPKSARLFGVPQAELRPDLYWFHKTGSAFDTHHRNFYGNIVDAGILVHPGKTLVIAAATTMHDKTSNNPDQEFEVANSFAALNKELLSGLGVGI